jgi:hypothetical protein
MLMMLLNRREREDAKGEKERRLEMEVIRKQLEEMKLAYAKKAY